MDRTERREAIEAYGLATVGLMSGIAIEGWRSAKELINHRRQSAAETGRVALQAVEVSTTELNHQVVYPDLSPAEKPPLAA